MRSIQRCVLVEDGIRGIARYEGYELMVVRDKAAAIIDGASDSSGYQATRGAVKWSA